jgi:arylsulfatase A-like enzyme
MRERRFAWQSFFALAALVGCTARPGAPPSGGTVRLIERYSAEQVEAAAPKPEAPLPAEWRFDGAAGESPVWAAGPHLAQVASSHGMLGGRTTGDFPVLDLHRPPEVDRPDQVHAIEVRMRVSAGGVLQLTANPSERVDLTSQQALARRIPWSMSTPLRPGAELQTYRLTPPIPLQGTNLRHLLLRPTDVAGAEFAIESVRVVFRREHLASLATGVAWQGLRDVFRECLVARAPERIRFRIDLPARPWLDLAVGTVEEHPVTFRVRASPAPGAAGDPIERDHTVTAAYRWEPLAIDLGGLAGRPVELTLEIAADAAGRIGLWGSPVVRSRAGLPAGRPSGVILIQADTLRSDHLEAYGHARETAPQLSRWAAEGTLFRHAFSQAAWTKVSTPSIHTGLYPSSHGVKRFYDRLPASAKTLAEAFREAGYATLSLSSVPFTGQMSNLHQGFEELHEASSLPGRTGPYVSKTARENVDRLLAWIERRGGSPFFAYLHVFDPHSPYEPYAPWDRLWVDAAARAEHLRQREAVTPLIAEEFMRVRQLPRRSEVETAGFDPAAYVAVETAWYDASIRGMDAELGRLFERLEATGLADATMVVLVSDHGTEFYEHGGFFHGHSIYGEITRVPLVARWPGRVAAGRVVDEVVQTIDVAPTLLELAGLAAPDGIQGQSLVPLLGADARAGADGLWPGWRSRPAVSEREPTTENDRLPPRNRVSQSLVEGPWKLIVNRSEGLPPFELYSWRDDPYDQTDVSAENPEVVARLSAMLDAWRRRAEAERLPPDSATAESATEEELQQLRSLGYIN